MKKSYLQFSFYSLIFLLITLSACQGKEPIKHQTNRIDTFPTGVNLTTPLLNFLEKKETPRDYSQQIGEFVREVYQDRKGNFWIGTLEYGIARYDGKSLTYFTTKDGLAGNQINGIAEDKAGNLWLTTTNGVSRIAEKSLSEKPIFTNFRKEDGLTGNNTWSILVDKFDHIWVGTISGLSRYDGEKFSPFDIPKARVENMTFKYSADLIWAIMEDKNGDLWFGTDGVGICKYNRNHKETGEQKFTHFTKKNGLSSNSVISILEDEKGHIWFGSRSTRVAVKGKPYVFVDSKDAGLSRYDGTKFTQFPEIEGFNGSTVGPIYKDKVGNVWIASMHHGVYRYNGKTFTNFKEREGFTINCIQSILEDKDGNMWFGFSGGLFKFKDGRFFNVKRTDF
ncbi:MAG: ligand-binding sensor domain-containing protein [Saprospiraceae bacterium]